MRVLLVSRREEDFFQIQDLLRRSPAPLEAELQHARSLEEAKLMLGKFASELVLIDSESVAAAAEMLSKFVDAGFVVPFVLLTENADERMVSEIIKAGAWDFLDKTHLTAASLTRTLLGSLRLHALRRGMHSAEEQVRKLSLALEQSGDSVIITNRDGMIEYVNQAFEEMNGYARDFVVGKNASLLNSGENDPAVFRQLWKTILAGSRYRGVMVNRKRTGETYQIEQSISPVRDEGGNITHFIASGRDLTEHRKLEAQLLQAQKLDAIGCLAGGVAHDFNNLLTIITSYAELALDEAPPQTALHTRIREVLTATGRAAELTRQLLAFSRKQPQSLRVVDLNSVVGNIVNTLRRLVGEDIEISFVADPEIAPVRVDPVQIEQILMNLASNARDAMPQGGMLLIGTRRAHLDDSYVGAKPALIATGDYVVLSAQDNGCGIPPDQLPHIFEPFYTTKPAGQGTGLGLATVYGIVKQNNGFVWAYSEVGMGTVLRIYLPCVRKERLQPTPSEAAAVKVPRGSETVLLVEDETSIRNAAAEFLVSCGYRVLPAANGRDALAVVKDHPGIEIVVTDVVMPEMSGGQLVEEIRRAAPQVRALFVSGYPGKTVAEHRVTLRASNFLQKPFSLKQLGNKVREVLDESLAVGAGG